MILFILFPFVGTQNMSLHGDDISQEGKPHNASSFQAVAFVTSTNIPVAKARRISKPNINRPKKYILPIEGGRS